MSSKPQKEPKYKVIFGVAAFVVALTAIIAWLTGAGALSELLKFLQPSTSFESISVGETVRFGEWDWRVLEVQDGRALLVTKEIIEQLPYNGEQTGVTWETCTLRAYLNGAFLEKFSARERRLICETENVNESNQWYGTNGGGNTTDKVFPLSLEEVVNYFGDSGQLKKGNLNEEYFFDDQYNDARAAKFDNDGGWWWLRSPGDTQITAAGIHDDGCVNLAGDYVFYELGVRPALWLKLT